MKFQATFKLLTVDYRVNNRANLKRTNNSLRVVYHQGT